MSNHRSSILRTLLLFCLPIAMYMAAPVAGGSAIDGDAPRLEMPATLVDLVMVQEGQVLKACFKMHNTGNQTLLIHEVKSSCGCTRVDHPRELAPSGRAELCLAIDTFGIHGMHKFKTAVSCNDPERPAITVQVRARIAPMVTLSPDQVFFRDAAGKDLSRDILIETKGERPLNVQLEGHNLGEKVSVALTPIAAGRQFRLSVRNLVREPGSYRGRIMLTSDHPGRERMVVPVFAWLNPPVAVYPARLVLDKGRHPAAGRFSGTLVVRAHDQKPLRILSVGPEQAGLSWTVETLIPDQAYRLEIAYPAANGPSPPPEMVIKTDRVDCGPLVVPLQLRR